MVVALPRDADRRAADRALIAGRPTLASRLKALSRLLTRRGLPPVPGAT